MTKMYYVRTNGFDMIVSDNGDVRRIYTSFDDIKQATNDYENREAEALAILENIEDDSSWEIFEETVEELTEGSEILAEIEW